MKYISPIFFLFLTFVFGTPAHTQVTNLVINGVSSNFTMTSGNNISWSYNIPTRSTTLIEIWIDVNANGSIDPLTDKTMFTFNQTDGDTNGNGGPPDLDGLVNGAIMFSQLVGLAPGSFVMKFTNNSASVTIAGTISPLASPAYTISGHVTPLAGKSPQYIVVEANRSEQYQPNFWDAITDASGNYTIQMNSDTAGNPWRLRLQNNPFPPSIVLPQDTQIVITGNHTGYDFTCYAAAAQVAGYLLDGNGSPVLNSGAYITKNDTTNFSRNALPRADGFFQIGFLSSELGSWSWVLQSETNNGGGNYVTTTELQAHVEIPAINSSDSLFHILKIYNTNSTIRGKLLLNGGPIGYSLQVTAVNPDTAISYTLSDSSTGAFTLPVTDKIHNYNIRVNWIPYNWSVPNIVAHPGDSNVVVSITQQTWTSVSYTNGWNMLSLPVSVSDNRKTSIFPFAVSNAFNFSAIGGYTPQTYLYNGVGYWVKFGSSNTQPILGTVIQQETVGVAQGWNLIGTPSSQVPTSNVVAIGTTIQSSFFGFGITGYHPETILIPGYAYWVKVNQPGTLVLVPSSVQVTPGHSRKRLEPIPPRKR